MNKRRLQAGFTAAEMLVATMIAAVVIGGAAMAYATFTRGQRQLTQIATVRLPNANIQNNFYGVNSVSITTYVAPNFGSVARAESMREKFVADVEQAVAVYCLYRTTNLNTVRPATIASPPYGTVLDTPEAFRTYLATAITASASIFLSYRNVPLSPTITSALPNVSIFVLGYSANATTIPVLAVYDIDFAQATNPNGTGTVVGTYASVRRYVSGTLTGYYDVIYPIVATGETENWNPSVVAFERRSRMALVEGTALTSGPDRFKVAAEQPFYFIFWPDPSRETLALPRGALVSTVMNPTYASTDPRRAYNHMAGRTAYMFTVPLFPSS